MDEYLDTLSIEILRLYRKNPDFNNYNLSQLKAMTNHGERALCATISLLRKRNYLLIDPTYSALRPKEVELLGNTVALDTPLRITQEGIIALEKAEQFSRRSQINEIRAWITLAIAFATFIMTIIQLLQE